MLDVPWPLAGIVAGALVAAIGVLWKRMTDKDDEHQKRYLELLDRYHLVVVALHESIEFKNPPEGGA